MAKSVNDLVLDGALNILKTTAILLTVCTTEPTTYAEASDTKKLADVAVDTNDFTIAPAVGGGRKVTIGAQNGVLVDISGNAEHVALCSADALLYVTTCTAQILTAGNALNIPAWVVTIANPT